MTPLMFGPASRQLFGLFHPAEAAPPKNTAVLICPPFGQEALRSHRFFKVLAERLARQGVATLRFDFYGSGDSPGAEAEGEFDGWRRDLCTAHEELRRLSPARRIVWLGARLGATLALLAAKSGRCDPDRLLLWEPILDGKRYARFLREQHVEALDLSYCIPDKRWRQQLAREPDAWPEEALGTALSPKLRQQLAALTPDSVPLTALHDTVVLAAPEDPLLSHWAQAHQASGHQLSWQFFRHPLVWTSDPHPNSAMVPAEALKHLLDLLHE